MEQICLWIEVWNCAKASFDWEGCHVSQSIWLCCVGRGSEVVLWKVFFTVCCRKKVINATTAWKWIILMMTSGTKTMYKTRARSSQDWNWKEKEGNSEQKGNSINTEWRTKREKFIMLQQVNVNKCKDNVKESDLTLIVIWICILCLEKRYIHKSQWCL